MQFQIQLIGILEDWYNTKYKIKLLCIALNVSPIVSYTWLPPIPELVIKYINLKEMIKNHFYSVFYLLWVSFQWFKTLIWPLVIHFSSPNYIENSCGKIWFPVVDFGIALHEFSKWLAYIIMWCLYWLN